MDAMDTAPCSLDPAMDPPILEEASEATCSVCLDSFTDARCLPCAHTFCLDCIRQLVKRGTPAIVHQPVDGLGWMFNVRPVCPLCRREFSLPYGVDALPRGRRNALGFRQKN